METFVAIIRQKFEQTFTNLNKYRDTPLTLALETEVRGADEDQKLFLTFTSEELSLSLALPVPYRDVQGNLLIGHRVRRAVGTWHHRGQELTYWQLMGFLLTENLEEAVPELGKRVQLERLVSGFGTDYGAMVFRDVEQVLHRFVNDLPLAGTAYEAWAMNQRVVFIDPEFEGLTPKQALAYQQELNRTHYPWTSLGLSDSSMVRNYLLKADLRHYTPFGVRHHNPKRNLYQTLGMKGDQTPVVLTQSAKALAKQGVERTGWNFMTAFIDLPLNFEDQLIVDLRHLDKFTCEERRFVCFGEVQVHLGDDIAEGDVLSVEPDGKEIRYWAKADSNVVAELIDDTVLFNGTPRQVQVITVRTKHVFKEGVKFTNMAGNKGVATFADCGVMHDPVRGEVRIDLIVSAKSVAKRKNYGQVLEALTTLMLGIDRERVVADNASVSPVKLSQGLIERGYRSDGTVSVTTQWGAFQAICGWVFWGVIKNPEVQLWRKAEVMATDNRQLRTAGLKISHIELKALMTIFGPRNPVVNEILSHQQGLPDVLELLDCLAVLRGETFERPVLSWRSVKPVVQKEAYFHPAEAFIGTVVDAAVLAEGFALELPRVCQAYIPTSEYDPPLIKVLPAGTDLSQAALSDGENVFFNKLLVPSTRLRNSWQHPTALWGMSDLGALLNTVVSACHRVEAGDAEEEVLNRAIHNYFNFISTKLSTKRGEIATYALSVRYPHSAKATATLAHPGRLPENTLEIHENMARDLQVKSGDYVIAERFPCLGFKSMRPQRVQVTQDPQCENVIRVSANSLVSQNLDFDGDVLFLMSFQTGAARAALVQQFLNPNPMLQAYIQEANSAKQPQTGALSLSDLDLTAFPALTVEDQVQIVSALTGIKRGTGSAVALAYNLMRIIEDKVGYGDVETNLALEVILDKVANSVFSQKHAGTSLEERARAAICQANREEMARMGFPAHGSDRLCQIIREEAAELGVHDLEEHYRRHLERGNSNIINLIVRRKHRLYFLTRSNLHPIRLLEYLTTPPSDLVSHLWYKGLAKLAAQEMAIAA